MTSKKIDPKARELAERVVQRQKLVDALLNSQFQLQGFGTTFKMGQDIVPTIAHVRYVLKQLWVMGYAEQYKLLPDDVPTEKLGTELAKEVVAWLVPTVIQNVERLTMAGSISLVATNNRSLVYIMDILGWYWYHALGGPKPNVNQLVRPIARRVVQDEALACPLCHYQFIPTDRTKTQEYKMWEYVAWLPTHCVEFHHYTPPARIRTWVKRTALQELKRFKSVIKKNPDIFKDLVK